MDFITLALIFFTSLLVYAGYCLSNKTLNLPPCPVRPLPLVGHLLALKTDRRPKFKQWREQCGDMFSVYLGSQLLVVINDFQLIKETFVKRADEFSDRPVSFLDKMTGQQGRGIVMNSGHVWKEQRSVALSILRKFGFGKNVLAERVQEEVSHYLDYLSSCDGNPVDIKKITTESTANIICSILTGKRYEYTHPTFQKLIKEIERYFISNKQEATITCFPFLKYLSGHTNMTKNMDYILKILREFIVKSKDKDPEDNFIASYVSEKDSRIVNGEATTMDEINLLRSVLDLFVAGTETTSTTICWFVLYMLNYPQVQKKIFDEINTQIGSGRVPSIQDRPKLVYLNAAIKETQRFASIVPQSVIRSCSKTLTIRNYTIPEGSLIVPNLDSVLLDKNIWGSDADVFNPDRFIDTNGQLKKPEEFIPFGVGRRVCLGESMAKTELFLYLSSLIQRFHLLPVHPDQPPPMDYIFGLTMIPKSYQLKLIERAAI
ncbi:cytochrome P450 2J2-like [Biomphalaria glabrata]|uniref:Cytochrome P450 2J2-like n=1 Tax=Biomphalaria glabrata TaxID=6526 RepID=A0A9U8E508_BIOGL|nr:cytochrome P450 2J2-like [Biomphalaria glabrata]